tara:strand:- start:1165 stop:1398 length:234 start_codon:yes stop_codon:yes gene_type:complete
MIAHQIKDGLVVNTIVVDSLDVLPDLVEATEGGIGWSYSNGVFTAPTPSVSQEPTSPTREELLAQLSALSAQIQALE